MTEKTEILLFDIDRTLFNTDQFINKMQEALILKIGVTTTDFEKAEELFFENKQNRELFDPDKYLTFLSDHFQAPKQKLIDLYWDRGRYNRHLYPETFSVLDTLSRRYEVGIYSEGIEKFQLFKLKSMAISLFINESYVNIFEDKSTKEAIDSLPKNSVVIDDTLRIVESIYKSGQKDVVWINRDSSKPHDEIITIFELDELLEIY